MSAGVQVSLQKGMQNYSTGLFQGCLLLHDNAFGLVGFVTLDL